MTGAEHYKEAERLVAAVSNRELTEVVLPVAQVHATLALVAAQITAVGSRGPGDVPNDFWEAVTS